MELVSFDGIPHQLVRWPVKVCVERHTHILSYLFPHSHGVHKMKNPLLRIQSGERPKTKLEVNTANGGLTVILLQKGNVNVNALHGDFI